MAQIIVGFHAIVEALKSSPDKALLYLSHSKERRNAELESLARGNAAVTIRKVDKAELERLSEAHKGAVLVVSGGEKKGPTTVLEFLKTLKEGEGALVLALDGITDVNNLGAILRSADQFSVDLVIIPQRRSAQLNQGVMKVSSGAAQYVQIASAVNLARELELLQKHGFWVYGADMGGQGIHQTKFPERSVIVMGSEEKGLGQLIRQKCDYIVSIPTSGHIDSLNVSVASAIFLYEFRRQRA